MKNGVIGFDLYDKSDFIPFDKLTPFFNQYLDGEDRNKTAYQPAGGCRYQ